MGVSGFLASGVARPLICLPLFMVGVKTNNNSRLSFDIYRKLYKESDSNMNNPTD